jgi:hypothetical protein
MPEALGTGETPILLHAHFAVAVASVGLLFLGDVGDAALGGEEEA